jgi:uncharacterized protein (DUF433 family)
MSERIATLPPDDPRVSRGLFTVAEAAAWLTVPRSTLHGWVHGYQRELSDGATSRSQPIVLSLPSRRLEAGIPFLGLAEGLVLSAFRRAGVPLQRIRPALDLLDREMGLRHALASDRLAVDGVEVLYDYGARVDPQAIGTLVTVRSGQCVLAPIVRECLGGIRYSGDHWAEQVQLPGYATARVIVNPDVALGRPTLEGSGVAVDDVVGRWIAGESVTQLAGRFGLATPEVEDVLRTATRRCTHAPAPTSLT